jgi:glycosyltransferase involved in cell wall biosynthesis
MFYARVVVRRLATRQHQVIAISQNTAADIAKFFKLPRERLTVIYNGLDHDRFQPGSAIRAKEKLAAHYGLHKPFLLYVARLEYPAKNHIRLIKAFDAFKTETRSECSLVLAGTDSFGAPIIHKAIRESPHSHDIHPLGFVAKEDLPTFYHAAELFVYPSLYEGFGLPPLEAMASGCPVLCSPNGALGEVIGSAAITINPEDVSSLKTQLVRLMADPGLRNQLRQAGLIQASKFNWAATAHQTLNVYARTLLTARGPVPPGDIRSSRRLQPASIRTESALPDLSATPAVHEPEVAIK